MLETELDLKAESRGLVLQGVTMLQETFGAEREASPVAGWEGSRV